MKKIIYVVKTHKRERHYSIFENAKKNFIDNVVSYMTGPFSDEKLNKESPKVLKTISMLEKGIQEDQLTGFNRLEYTPIKGVKVKISTIELQD